MNIVKASYKQEGADCGRMVCSEVVETKKDLANQKIFIKAGSINGVGPKTVLISNKETCEIGYCLAEAARDRGAYVILVADLVEGLDVPDDISFCRVSKFEEMQDTVSSFRKPEHIVIEAYQNKLDLSNKEELKDKSKMEIANNILDEMVQYLK